MTLGDFFEMLSANPSVVIFYFIAIPITAFLAYLFGKDEGHLSPWKYLYSCLVYLVAIPGIFAITLNIYLFLFERMPILETNIFTQILPIISMIASLLIIRKNVSFDDIPGFGRLSALMFVLGAILSLMWILDKTHIIAITFIPFHWVIVALLLILVIFRVCVKQLFGIQTEVEEA